MKKTGKKTLVLRKETLKALTSEDLYTNRVGGGTDSKINKCSAGWSGCSTQWAFKCSYAF